MIEKPTLILVFSGLDDTSDLWLLRYESDNFKAQMETIWNDVRELYEKLYGFVRYRLRQWYPHDFTRDDDPIPAHLLGMQCCLCFLQFMRLFQAHSCSWLKVTKLDTIASIKLEVNWLIDHGGFFYSVHTYNYFFNMLASLLCHTHIWMLKMSKIN